ncbi:MAG: DUF554 domain-containing protein [Desulfobacteraceae bacterium]|nr:DUF554 domain-containing protein [Desulfobacteraceae bacterium]
MVGTLINVGAIAAGTAVGVFTGGKLPARIRETVLVGIGLVMLLVGVQMAVGSRRILIVLGSVLLGAVLGEALRIEERLERFGELLQEKFAGERSGSLGEAFVTSSIFFCVGPMAVLGPMADGLGSGYSLLVIKAVMDAFCAVAFAASLGWGVGLGAVSILVYQGSITLFAQGISSVLTDPMIVEMTATGGVVIMAVAIKTLKLMELRSANLVPAIGVAPVLVALADKVGAFF